MTGLYEIDTWGHVRVRSNIDAPAVERFLAEVKGDEFNRLLQMCLQVLFMPMLIIRKRIQT